MARNTSTTSDVSHSENTCSLITTKCVTEKGNIVYVKIAAYDDYEKPFSLVYGSNYEEVFEQLDELIGKLQAIRQDLDVTTHTATDGVAVAFAKE